MTADSPYYIEGENLKNLTEKRQSLQYKKLYFAPHGSFPLLPRSMATTARLPRACQRETAKKSPIYKEAEKPGNVSEKIHFLWVSKRA